VVRFTPRPFTPRERALVTHCIEDWVGSGAVLNAVVSFSCRELNPSRPVRSCSAVTDLPSSTVHLPSNLVRPHFPTKISFTFLISLTAYKLGCDSRKWQMFFFLLVSKPQERFSQSPPPDWFWSQFCHVNNTLTSDGLL
jgi:hypothetical protein